MAAPDQLQAGLEQELLGEGVAHLHLGPAGVGVLAQLLAGEGGPVDAVAPGARAHRHQRVAVSVSLAPDELFALHDAQAHHVDDRIALVAAVEVGLAAEVGDAHAVAVVAGPAHDAVEEVAHAARVQVPEVQRVEHRDRAGAHGEDVAQDPSDAGGRALVGFDGGRVVVRLDLERERVSVADVDHPRVLARALDDPGGLGGQEAKQAL